MQIPALDFDILFVWLSRSTMDSSTSMILIVISSVSGCLVFGIRKDVSMSRPNSWLDVRTKSNSLACISHWEKVERQSIDRISVGVDFDSDIHSLVRTVGWDLGAEQAISSSRLRYSTAVVVDPMRLVASSQSAALIEAGLQYQKHRCTKEEDSPWILGMDDGNVRSRTKTWDGSSNLWMTPCIRVCRRWAIQH